MQKASKIFVAGHRGMVGSAIFRRLQFGGFNGEIVFDSSKPDGAHSKLLDVSRMNRLGWHLKTSLREGVALAYLAYRASIATIPDILHA